MTATMTTALESDSLLVWADQSPSATTYGNQIGIPCVFMRGGTSRGAILKIEDLPSDAALQEALIVALYGSPDVRQINGLGGATGQTSKVCVIGRPDPAIADIDYTFGQVRIDEPAVDFVGNCGNMTSAVAAFAIDEGYVAFAPDAEHCEVRIHLTNTDQIVRALVPIADGRAAVYGSHHVDGVPGLGAPIDLDFSDTIGTLDQGVLPFDEPSTELSVDGQSYRVSVVDVGNATVFVRPEDVGMTGLELPSELTEEMLARLLAIRGEVAYRMGRCASPSDAQAVTPATPKVYVVSPARDYRTMAGDEVYANQISLCARGLIMGLPHESHAASVGVCAAVASRIAGTVVHDLLANGPLPDILDIGHPSGVMSVRAVVSGPPQAPVVERASLVLTARRLMSGVAYVSAGEAF